MIVTLWCRDDVGGDATASLRDDELQFFRQNKQKAGFTF